MFPASFHYLQAHSIDEALAALLEHGPDARILAGGQSLIPAMRYRLARPAVLVDITPIPGFAYLREAGGMLEIGAGTRDSALESAPHIKARYHLLADAAAVIADPVVRQSGTVVGSLCHNDPAGDWGVVALASRAEIVVRGSAGNRRVPIDDFLIDSYTTAVADGEVALEVRFPQPGERTSGSYQKIERKVGDFATAAAAVQLTLDTSGNVVAAGIAIGAAGPTARRVAAAEAVLIGQRPSTALLRAAAAEARDAADPVADARGDVAFKREMAAVLVYRGLVATLQRIQQGAVPA